MLAELRRSYRFRAGERELELGRQTRYMGIVNVTPDSFSDGGLFYAQDAAVERCRVLLEEGADLLDIGGESTRPGSETVEAREQIRRVLPVIERIRPETDRMISVDTSAAEVAEAALKAGAEVVNDISGLRFDSRMPGVVETLGAGVVLMHCRGTPRDMHLLPPSENILADVSNGLQLSVDTAHRSRIPGDRIVLDPGIGFGKNGAENLVLLNRLACLKNLDFPILVGVSRKRFIGDVLGAPVGDRLMGTAGACAAAVLGGAHILRVHDVGLIRQAIRVVDAIWRERIEP